MLQYIVRRLLWMVPTLLGITVVVFVVAHSMPGDPATVALGIGGTGEMQEGVDVEARIAAFRKEHGLDLPLWKQYLNFLGPFNLKENGHAWFGGSGVDPWEGLLALDLGTELQNKNRSVMAEMGKRLKITVSLSLIAVLLSYLIAIPAGIVAAVRSGTRLDGAMTLVLFVLYSIPTFWGGLMLILIFGKAGLGWLPVLGLQSPDAETMSLGARVWDMGLHAVLPIATLTYGSLAYLSRQMRVGMIDVIHQDFIRTARAKGLSERVVVLKHALRNSLIPVITIFASILPILVGGSIIVETVFDIPGMGLYTYKGLLNRDYNIMMATVTFSAFMTLIGILMSDIAYGLADPRISYD